MHSQSFLTALDKPTTVDLLLQQLMALCHSLGHLGISFTFVWCPGHIGIESNEEADTTLRNAADSPHFDVDAISKRSDNAKVAAAITVNNVCQQMWNTRQSKLSAVKQSVSKCQMAGYRSPNEACITKL